MPRTKPSNTGLMDEHGLGVMLQQKMLQDPEQVVSILLDNDAAERSITAGELAQRASEYANSLDRCTDPNKRKIVSICLFNGLDLHAAWIACLWVGHIPTFISPPSPRMEPEKYTNGFRDMMTHIGSSVQIVSSKTKTLLNESMNGNIHLLVADEIAESKNSYDPVPLSLDEVALLQHSSGTTGLQKAIALTGRQVLCHNYAYMEWLDITSQDKIVSWLPLYHDMGFVACFLLPLLHGILLIEMSPFDWVRNPAQLFATISRHRATLCWLPNFAFSFMAATCKPDHLPVGIDVSCIRAWINSSEPVMSSSFDSFLQAFSDYGVRREQLTTSYAMAENVYAVSQSKPGQLKKIHIERNIFTEQHRVVSAKPNSKNAVVYVSNGRVLPTTKLSINDQQGTELPEGKVGEIHLRGEHRFAGYYGHDELNQQVIDKAGWYNTGDLGFIYEQELYITGRSKDLIIIQGRNFYPGDIEASVNGVNGVVPGRVAAFGITDIDSGTEQLVIVTEIEADHPQPKLVSLKIRNHIAQKFNCTAGDVRAVPARWLIKSTSGKVARSDNRNKYLNEFRHT